MIDWTATALVFPGQGSQIVGMGRDWVDSYPAAREIYARADDVLGIPFSKLCFDGPEADLNDTYNTQPALFVCGMAALAALRAEFGDFAPGCVAGHSLGEFTALAAAGALTFEDGLRLVRERGRLMREAGERSPGAMAALLGLDADAVRKVCTEAQRETGGVLVLANDNCPGQIVISGDNETLDRGLELAKAAGAKRAVKLAVSIASHSPLMESAAEAFESTLNATMFHPFKTVVFGNVTAAPLPDVDAIRVELSAQLTKSVRWTESIQHMITGGTSLFLELGPKDVLTGLLRRIDSSAAGAAINSTAALAELVQKYA